MRVGIFLQGDRKALDEHFRMGALACAAVHKSIPCVEVVHLSDGTTEQMEGSDSVLRIGGAMPMAMRRMLHNATVEGEWLFIDPDVIVQQDVGDVFNDAFDVALTDRLGTITYEGAYAKQMPFNLGVSFSRNGAFWKRVLYHMHNLSPKLQYWEGDQLVIAEMMRLKLADDFNVKVLPGLKYNFPPKSENDERMKDAAICHWKGQRKQWLLKEAA